MTGAAESTNEVSRAFYFDLHDCDKIANKLLDLIILTRARIELWFSAVVPGNCRNS